MNSLNMVDKDQSFFSLPESFRQIDDGVGSNGWSLCRNESLLAFWTPENGWEKVSCSIGVERFDLCGQGVICTDNGAEHVGLFSPVFRRIEWTVPMASLVEIQVFDYHVTEKYLLVVGAGAAGLELHVFVITCHGLTKETFLKFSPESLAVWDAKCLLFFEAQTVENSPLIYMLARGALFSICIEPGFQAQPQKIKYFGEKLGQKSVYPAFSPVFETKEAIFFDEIDKFLVRFDKARLEPENTKVNHIEGCHKILGAYQAEDRPKARKMIELVMKVERPALEIDWSIYDVVLNANGLPAAAITTKGLYAPEKITGFSLSDWEDKTSLQVPLLPWLFWLQWEEAETCALDLVLKRRGEDELLVATIVSHLGKDACHHLFANISGRPLPESSSFGEDRVKALFGAFGSKVALLVESKLEDKTDPYAQLVACCASAALDKEGRPALWSDDRPAPADAILRLLAHPKSIIRQFATTAAGELQLQGAAPVICKMIWNEFGINAHEIRQRGADALSRIPDAGRRELSVVRQLALLDTDQFVRAKALEALGRMGDSPEIIDNLICALGDMSFFVNMSASDVLADKCAKYVAPENVHRLCDLTIANELILKAGGEGTFNGVEVIEGILRKIDSQYEDIDAYLEMPFEYRKAMGQLSLVLIYLQVFLTGKIKINSQDEETMDELFAFFDASFAQPISTRQEFKNLLEGSGREKAGLVIAGKVFAQDPDTGIRAGLLAWAGLSFETINAPRDFKASSDAGFQPLHMRLRHASLSPSPQIIVERKLRRRMEESCLEAGLILLVMALQGDQQCLEKLKARILAGEFTQDAPCMAYCCYYMLPQEERSSYVSAFIRSEDIALQVRAIFWEEQYGKQNDLQSCVDPESLKKLYADIVKFQFADFRHRWFRARDLQDMGDGKHLETFWCEAQQQGRITEDDECYFHIDMATLGHCSHMEKVRKLWLESGDYRALMAFAKLGTPADIPALESSLDEGLSKEHIRKTIAQIKKRWKKTGQNTGPLAK